MNGQVENMIMLTPASPA